jgi:hypothetical protein
MSAPKQIQKLVTAILKDEQRKGSTTKQTVIVKAMHRITEGGGPAHYGIGHAYVIHATAQAVGAETDRQFKAALPENVFRMPMRNAPPDLVQTMHKLPAWIATAEGPAAPWVPSIKASADDWMHNFNMKRDIADRTMKAANTSRDMAQYLKRHGLRSLSEALNGDH